MAGHRKGPVCTKGMRACPVTCGHREMVMAYRAEYERELSALEEKSRGNKTEINEGRHRLITFQKWLEGNRGSGRRAECWHPFTGEADPSDWLDRNDSGAA